MADVEILDVRAVFERFGIVSVEHTAVRGLRGKDALYVRAHTVGVAEPDAPDDLDVGISIADGGHVLIGDTAAVHVDADKIRHTGHGLHHLRAVVIDRDMAEVNGSVNGAEFLAVEPEGVADRSVRAGVHDGADGIPSEV